MTVARSFLGRSRQMRVGTGRNAACKHCGALLNYDRNGRWLAVEMTSCSGWTHEPDLPPDLTDPEALADWLEA